MRGVDGGLEYACGPGCAHAGAGGRYRRTARSRWERNGSGPCDRFFRGVLLRGRFDPRRCRTHNHKAPGHAWAHAGGLLRCLPLRTAAWQLGGHTAGRTLGKQDPSRAACAGRRPCAAPTRCLQGCQAARRSATGCCCWWLCGGSRAKVKVVAGQVSTGLHHDEIMMK